MTYNTRNPAVKRLLKEAQELHEPSELYHAQPLEDNLFEWHFTIRGPEDTDFSGGVYHGRILLPSEYPMKPPNIVLLTPNGRFETHRKICLSISGYHPESWRPSWSIRTALLAIIGFMPTHGAGAIGSLDLPREERRALARESNSFVCDSCGCIRDLLRPLTDASKALSQEATETASQISMTSDGDGRNTRSTNEPPSSPSTLEPSNSTDAPSTSVSSAVKVTLSTTSECPASVVTSIPPSTTIHSVSAAFPIAPLFGNYSRPDYPKHPTEVAYWMCYPVYFQPMFFDPRQYITAGTALNSISPISATTSLTTTTLSANGERTPLGFADWLKQLREKRDAGLACDQPLSPDPASAPLTRAVVTNSTTCLSHRASASFSIHRNSVDSRATTEVVTAAQSANDEAIAKTTIAPQDECVARLHSKDTLASENSKDTLIERKTDLDRSEIHTSSVNVCTTSGVSGATHLDDEFGMKVHSSIELLTYTDKARRYPLMEDAAVSDDVIHIKGRKSAEKLDCDNQRQNAPAISKVPVTLTKVSDTTTETMEPSLTHGVVVSTVGHESFQMSQNEFEEPTSVLSRRAIPSETPENGLPSRPSSADVQLPRSTDHSSQPQTAAPSFSIQYRAATVCAASVAVALILVIMRRLSLMLHGT